VAGGPGESVFQPQWSPDNTLYWCSDRTGWWNIYRLRSAASHGQGGDDGIDTVTDLQAEFGLPQWAFGMSTYFFTDSKNLFCVFTREGTCSLARVDTDTLELEVIDTPYTELGGLHATGEFVVFRAASPSEAPCVVCYTPDTGQLKILRKTSSMSVDPGYVSQPEAIDYPTTEGATAHALFYRPTNRDYEGPARPTNSRRCWS